MDSCYNVTTYKLIVKEEEKTCHSSFKDRKRIKKETYRTQSPPSCYAIPKCSFFVFGGKIQKSVLHLNAFNWMHNEISVAEDAC